MEKHRKFCSNLCKKERRIYYELLDMRNQTDNRNVFENNKTPFCYKAKGNSDITLIEIKEVITSAKEVAETLNKHFIESVKELVDIDSSRTSNKFARD